MDPITILAIGLGGLLVYKIAAAPKSTTAPTANQAPAGQPPSGRRTIDTSGDASKRNVDTAPIQNSAPAGVVPAPAPGGISGLRFAGGLSKLSGLRVDISEDREFGIDTLPDDGEGSLRSLVRSMFRIYNTSVTNGSLGLYPWDADFVRSKADVLVSEFGAERAAARLRMVADNVAAAYAARMAVSDADDVARAEASAVERARRSFPSIMSMGAGKLAGELQSMALHMEWRARLASGGSTDPDGKETTAYTIWLLYADPDYAPPSVEQMDSLLARTSGIYGDSSPLTSEVRAIRDAIANGQLNGGASSGSASFSYDNYISAASSIADSASAAATSAAESAPSAPSGSSSGGFGGGSYSISGGFSL